MTTRNQRLSQAGRFSSLLRGHANGEQTHLMVVYLDDPPPFRFSQDYYAKFAPENPASGNIDEQQLYPKTPFLDFMASKGMQYTRATNTAVCSSGRASLQTGEYPTVHGVGTIIREDRSGDLAEFRDTGFTAGTPLATSLGTGVYKGFVGKLHLSLNTDEGGLEWDIADRSSGESGSGRLGDWDRRVLWLNNANQTPLPDEVTGAIRGDALSEGNVADDAAEGGSSGGSYYFHRYRDETQERNVGTIKAPFLGGGSPQNTNGIYSETIMADECIAFWKTVAAQAEPGFLLHTPHLTHAPYDLPPPGTCGLAPKWYDLAISDPSAVPVWLRQQAMAEALDFELHRVYASIPAEIRDNLVTIVCADNGIDGFYLDSLVEEGLGPGISKDMGAHWTLAYEEQRAKSTLFRAGIFSQMFAVGPGIEAGFTDAMIEVAVDLHETICVYFGATSGTGVGVDFSNTWDGTVQLADHDRTETQHSYFWPHGSPNPATQTELANKAQWLTATGYVVGDERFNVSSAGVPTNYVCTSNHTSGASTEPGVGANWDNVWDALAERHVAVTKYYPSGVSGEAAGVWKLYRRLHDVLEGDNVTDLLWRTHDVDGLPVDEFEMTALDVTDAANNATYAALDTILDAINV